MRYRYDEKTGKVLRLNEKTGKWVPDRKKAKGFDFSKSVNFVPDIREFVANATDKVVLISSRSQLARYERANNIRQCGDFKTGEIAQRRTKKIDREYKEAVKAAGLRPEQVKPLTWSDFS